jgi:hypothetical protein
MSPRAACRLATLGFREVCDYAAGKVDWLAHGLPAEGSAADRPTAGTLTRDDVATCSLDDPAGEVLARIATSPYGYALVLDPSGVLLGRVRRSALEAGEADIAVEQLMEPGPSTIRPHVPGEDLAKRLERSRVAPLVVTSPGGVLVGVYVGTTFRTDGSRSVPTGTSLAPR